MKLTPRETAVVRLLADGLSAKQIGTKLGIAARTVERYADQARLKCGAHNRVDLVVSVMRSGILDKPM